MANALDALPRFGMMDALIAGRDARNRNALAQLAIDPASGRFRATVLKP